MAAVPFSLPHSRDGGVVALGIFPPWVGWNPRLPRRPLELQGGLLRGDPTEGCPQRDRQWPSVAWWVVDPPCRMIHDGWFQLLKGEMEGGAASGVKFSSPLSLSCPSARQWRSRPGWHQPVPDAWGFPPCLSQGWRQW